MKVHRASAHAGANQAPCEGEHLLLSAGKQSCTLARALAQERESFKYILDRGIDFCNRPCNRPEPQVVGHTKLRKDLPAFRYGRKAPPCNSTGLQTINPRAKEDDLAFDWAIEPFNLEAECTRSVVLWDPQ
jgi:hypothetical protein